MKEKDIQIPIRKGKPTLCIVCGGNLHKKSEYYCSKKCAEEYTPGINEDKPDFRSKWKERKLKELKDPLILIRSKVRQKTKNLVRKGKIKKKSCIVCGNKKVIAHHEDYRNPLKVIWMCQKHHKDYHEGKIALFNNKLKWDPKILTDTKSTNIYPKEKYNKIDDIYHKNNLKRN